MADAAEDAVRLAPARDAFSATLRLSIHNDEEEEKVSDAEYGAAHDAVEADANAVYGGLGKAPLPSKDRHRATSDASVEDASASDAEGGDDSALLKRRPSPASPSRLTASLLVGRDRMARAAKAWRDGARRAGLFGGDDDDEEEDEEEEDNLYAENEEKKNEWGSSRARESTMSAEGMRDSLDCESEVIPDSTTRKVGITTGDPNPAEDELEPLTLTLKPQAESLLRSVPRLVPSRLAPATRLPKMAQLWAFLDRIECIAIRDVYTTQDDDDSSATVHYILDVYTYQEQHSLPTHRYQGDTLTRQQPSLLSQTPPLREPDYHIQHRFSDFTKLRSRLLKTTHHKHPRAPHHHDAHATRAPSSSYRHCFYCQKITLFLAAGTASIAPLGWKAKLFTTVDMRKTLLSQFVSQLVVLARAQRNACSNLATLSAIRHPPSRYVHRSVPGILRRFLTVQTGENFMR